MRTQQLVLPWRQAMQSPQDRYGKPAARLALLDDAGKLVAHDPGVFEERLVAVEDMQVGAADANPLDADQGFARGAFGFRTVKGQEGSGFFADDGEHLLSPDQARRRNWEGRSRLLPGNDLVVVRWLMNAESVGRS
mgnify:CR=1 FL=1